MNTSSQIPVTTVYADEAPGGLVVAPTSAQFHTGVEPEMTAPAPWWNYFIKLMTETNIGAKADILAILTELNNTLSFFGVTPDPLQNNQLATGLAGKFGYLMFYDLVIDSDTKLAAWAASGTYEKVLIKTGTWTLASGGVDLTARGTKLVVGEPGSKLVFSSAEKGLYYTTLPTTNDYRMERVTVECTFSGACSGFVSCTNLANCTGTGTNGDGSGDGIGFHICTKLTNCIGTGTGTNSDGNGSGIGFHSCTSLTNCTGTGTGDTGRGFYICTSLTNCTGTGTGTNGDGYGFGYGFYTCTKLTNCTGTGTGTGVKGYGFYTCTNLTNCTGTGTNSDGSGSGIGFYICTNLTNCTGTGTGVKGYGFYTCTNLTNCTGTGTGTNGYAFYECHGFDFNCSGTSNNKENVHRKYLYGITASTQGGTAEIAHGLDSTKIKSIEISFHAAATTICLNRIESDATRGANICAYANASDIRVTNSNSVDLAYRGCPMEITIEYWE